MEVVYIPFWVCLLNCVHFPKVVCAKHRTTKATNRPFMARNAQQVGLRKTNVRRVRKVLEQNVLSEENIQNVDIEHQ